MNKHKKWIRNKECLEWTKITQKTSRILNYHILILGRRLGLEFIQINYVIIKLYRVVCVREKDKYMKIFNNILRTKINKLKTVYMDSRKTAQSKIFL